MCNAITKQLDLTYRNTDQTQKHKKSWLNMKKNSLAESIDCKAK